MYASCSREQDSLTYMQRSELFPGQLKKIRWLNKTAHPELAMTYTVSDHTVLARLKLI